MVLERKVRSIEDIINTAPNEKHVAINRESRTFRIDPDLWIEFDYFCKKSKTTRSDEIEKFIRNMIV